jgi:hypothetical protein
MGFERLHSGNLALLAFDGDSRKHPWHLTAVSLVRRRGNGALRQRLSRASHLEHLLRLAGTAKPQNRDV